MARPLKPSTREQLRCVAQALDALRNARRLLQAADAPQALAKVQAAIKSTEGAQRHAQRRVDASGPAGADLVEACEGFTCQACGRPEAACSAEPCEAVQEDRGAVS